MRSGLSFGRVLPPETRRQNGGVSSLASVLFGVGQVCGMTDHEFGISGRTDERVCYRAQICLSNDCKRSRSCVPTRKSFGRGYSRSARAPTPGHSTSSGSEHRGQVLTRTVRSIFFSSTPRRLPRLPALITTFWRVTAGFLSAEPLWTNGGVRGTALVAE